ncbi:glycoside hydrolase family 88 protein [Cucurbitaria berberidis CBS 394.84]|uniref:Glycoside hydrolase family 88 protein n=1 Tax=Cucurbitaria berberidis CBS 394.84 TaxID=1168544 RepID=A0A9P4L8H0_9PLEO|nr:glycoside hydrolase family 88 protein [Cucurbitaria berberidis CBS 394.84]KAF1845258.1 glycoside hydrolase family 88 protein [Cucurbitaria berberidis CBS 394.84]
MGDARSDVKKYARSARVKGVDLSNVYSENVAAKIFQVAQRGLKQQAPLPFYPHTVPQEGLGSKRYEEREADFWTCGFFPGCIYALLERAMLYPQAINIPDQVRPDFQDHLLKLGRHWGVAINEMSSRTDTHDMGFIVQPALQKDWELTGNKESLQSVMNAAYALASRYDDRVKAIRSWDVAINDRYSITDMNTNFLVIIDSMCNLDLLYYVGYTQNDQSLIDIATQHADSIIHEILRPDFSSYHLVNFDPRSGLPQAKMTNQGWKDNSTWSRGQSWAIMGFAQTFSWTKDIKYLDTSIKCSEYFLRRCREGEGRWPYHMVPLWDFDAPQENSIDPLRDVSAGVIAANGLLIIHQSLQSLPTDIAAHLSSSTNFLETALLIMSETLDMSYDRDLASFDVLAKALVNGNPVNDVHGVGEIRVKESGFEGLLRNSTTNWNEHAHMKYKDHGLVYADYYLLEFGNKLLRMGLL